MSKLNYYKVEIRPCPWTLYGEQMYEITAHIDGEKISSVKMTAEQLPCETEMEMMNRLSMDMVHQLKKREKHKNCCCCCETKKCQK